MNIPAWFLQVSVLAVAGIGGFGFRFLLGRIEENARKHEAGSIRIHARLDTQDTKVVTTLEKMVEKMVTSGHCDGRQELWQLRFDAMMEANGKEHTNLINTLKGVTDELKELGNCVEKLVRGAKNC